MNGDMSIINDLVFVHWSEGCYLYTRVMCMSHSVQESDSLGIEAVSLVVPE